MAVLALAIAVTALPVSHERKARTAQAEPGTAAKGWFQDPDFFGCIFINAAVEYSEPGHPINIAAREFKAVLRNFAREQAVQGGAADPDTLADQIHLLFEGATMVAQVSGRPDAATIAGTIAAMPSAIVSTAMAVKPGVFSSVRIE